MLRALLLSLSLSAWCAAFDTVVIDAGHGGSDPGAVRGKLMEKHLCLDVAKRLESALRANGVRTIMTRRTDVTVSLDRRVRVANAYPHAVFVSIHFNASRTRSARGMETFYMSKRGSLVASAIQSRLDAQVPGRDRGTSEENFKVLRGTKGTAVLVECGFISNAAEAVNANSWRHRQKIASSIATGLLSVRRKV